MERKVYIKSWKTNAGSSLYCVNKELKEEIETLFKDFKYELRIKDFDDKKSVCLIKNDYDVSDREFWYLVLTILKDNGYEFSSYLTTRYAWYESEHLKAEEEKAELKKQERERQEKERLEKIKLEESEYALVCGKFGCITNIGFCLRKCKHNTVYNMNCRPERVEIKKEGI